jgi:hypothetical protein
MAEARDRRQRRPKRPIVYAIILAVCGAVALGSAWATMRPAGKIVVIWRGKPQWVPYRKAQDAGPAAP